MPTQTTVKQIWEVNFTITDPDSGDAWTYAIPCLNSAWANITANQFGKEYGVKTTITKIRFKRPLKTGLVAPAGDFEKIYTGPLADDHIDWSEEDVAEREVDLNTHDFDLIECMGHRTGHATYYCPDGVCTPL